MKADGGDKRINVNLKSVERDPLPNDFVAKIRRNVLFVIAGVHSFVPVAALSLAVFFQISLVNRVVVMRRVKQELVQVSFR